MNLISDYEAFKFKDHFTILLLKKKMEQKT